MANKLCGNYKWIGGHLFYIVQGIGKYFRFRVIWPTAAQLRA